jgi:predicted metal-dependent hydrolase
VNVEVIRSPRRRKTVQARRVNGVVRVTIPATMTMAEEERWVAEMVRRLERSAGAANVDLEDRAADLADRYEFPRPSSIRWVDNQELRWGSCTPVDGSIRISSKLLREPGWVLDYVIVHELTHLLESNHNARFDAFVARYPRSERAQGFLDGYDTGVAAAGLAGSSPPGDTRPDATTPGPTAAVD